MPISGVNIIDPISKKGTLSDFEGNFKLNNLKKGSKIEFSYLGYKVNAESVAEGYVWRISR